MIYRGIILLSLLSVGSYGQLINTGPCPAPKLMTNFSQITFSGTWYTLAQYPTLYETPAICPTINFVLNSDLTYNIQESENIYNIMTFQLEQISWSGKGKFDNTTVGYWTWNVNFWDLNFPSIPYQIIDTDYETYATLFSCISIENIHFEFLWIMTKRYPLLAPLSAFQNGIAAAYNAGLNTIFVLPSFQLPVFCSLPTFDDLKTWINSGFNG